MQNVVSIASQRPRAPKAKPGSKPNTVSLLGLDLVDAPMAEIGYHIAERAQGWVPTRIAFLNAHCANVMRSSTRYAQAMKSADLVLPDGAGVALAAKFAGVSMRENLNGTDLFPVICRCLALRKIPVYFLGGRPGVADDAAANAKRQFPNLNVAGIQHGYFPPQNEEKIIEQINNSGARVVFVAFGVPGQDIFLARIAQRLNAPVTLGVGGLLDFVSGRIPRAPSWMRKMGLEWTYRFRQEPFRMWRRYTLGNLSFLSHIGKDWAKRKLGQLASTMDRMLTRTMDVVASGAGLLVLSPFLLGVAYMIRNESEGPALFRQTRVGEDGKEFELFKFRSMSMNGLKDDEKHLLPNDRADGVTFKLKKDPRITKVGAFIRKFSIDELPQLWNVFKGDMSLVGPRPALPKEVELYSAEERGRLAGKPGITCTWQIGGRADLPFEKQVALDIEYLKTRNIFKDILILLKTPHAVVTAKGAY